MNKWLTSAVDTYIREYGKTNNPVIYDVGSRDGEAGIELAQRIFSGTNLTEQADIVLFECNPPQIEVIKHKYPFTTLIPYAISDVSGKTVDFVQMKGDKNIVGSSSMDLNRVNEPWLNDYEIIQVKTKRLDEVIEELGHDEIDIMKIDIEHYSYQALIGIGKHLRKVKVYHIETEPEGKARAETSQDVALFMQHNGYKLVDTSYEWGPEIEDHVYLRID